MDLSLIAHYDNDVVESVKELITHNKLDDYISVRYPDRHDVTSNRALFEYAQKKKKYYMKRSGPLHKVVFDDKIEQLYDALGFNRRSSVVQGRRLKASNEIRVSSIFKVAPESFLDMIIVHELAHLKHKEHDKRFYSLCEYMEPDYYQLEFDLRLYLIKLNIDR